MYIFNSCPKYLFAHPQDLSSQSFSFEKSGFYILACKGTNFFLFHNETSVFFQKKT